MSNISQQDLESLLELFDRSQWRQMRLQGLGVDLFLSKDPDARRPVSSAEGSHVSPTDAAKAIAAPSAPEPAKPPPSQPIPDSANMLHVTASLQSSWVPVRAPCLGTFYRAPKPGAPPFVAVGQRVDTDTEVCIVEVMKLFTTVRAGVAGTVREVLVKDSELVEFGQPLVLIEPDA